jgi:hypothetical protein
LSEKEKPSSSPVVEVAVDGNDPVCGALKSADRGRLRIEVSGESRVRVFRFEVVKNLRVKNEC